MSNLSLAGALAMMSALGNPPPKHGKDKPPAKRKSKSVRDKRKQQRQARKKNR